MALTATIFRVNLEITDIDRSVYRGEALRLALHPSEEAERLVARLLAYALLWEEGLAFGKDLADAEEPALWRWDDHGQLAHWIEVGTPTAKRLHIKSKAAPRLTVVVYKGQDDGREGLRRELARAERMHRPEAIEVLCLPGALVEQVAAALARSSAVTVIAHGDGLQVVVDDASFAGTLIRCSLADLMP